MAFKTPVLSHLRRVSVETFKISAADLMVTRPLGIKCLVVFAPYNIMIRMPQATFSETLAGRLLYALVFAVPLVFWPGVLFSAEATKKYLFLSLVLAALLAYLISQWQSASSYRLSSWWIIALWLPPAVAFLSSLASGAPRHSLIGLGLEPDTFFSLIFFSLLATLVPLLWQSRRDVFKVFLSLLGLGVAIGLFQLGRLLLGNFTTLEIFDQAAINLIGKWNELGIFFGLVFIVGLVFIHFLPWRRTWLLQVLILGSNGLAAFFILLVNHFYVWIGVGLAAFMLAGAEWLAPRPETPWPFFKRWLLPASLICLISLTFAWAGAREPLSGYINNLNTWFNVSVLEVSPSWQGTYIVSRGVLGEDPLFGSGPNKFSNVWFRYRPIGVNETLFWQNDFRAGVGSVPTAVATLGLAGAAAYLLLLAVVVIAAGRLIVTSRRNDRLTFGLKAGVAVATFYLWFVHVVYVPGVVLTMLTFLFTGLLILSDREEVVPSRSGESWLDRLVALFSRTGGVIAALILLILLVQSFWSNFTYNRGLLKLLAGEMAAGELAVARAANVNGHDLFYRSLVDVALTALNDLAKQPAAPPTELQNRFQLALTAGVDNGRKAVAYNPTNFLNWLYLGRIYEAVVPLKVNGAYEQALKAYEEAQRLSPNVPSVHLSLARLKIAAGRLGEAREHLQEALRLKRDYTEAIFVLAQLDTETGNLAGAISLAEQAAAVSPQDPVAHFSLGLLRYQARHYTAAREALSRAVELNPNYANARYFLGLAYDALGERSRALGEFKELLKTNNLPELRQMVANLEAGRSALSNTSPPAPEDRDTLPVKEE